MRLRKERTAANLTQVQLSKLSGVKQSTISKLEGTSRTRPSFDTLEKLAQALNRRGRKVQPRDLASRQPLLIKGARALAHRGANRRRSA